MRIRGLHNTVLEGKSGFIILKVPRALHSIALQRLVPVQILQLLLLLQ